MIRNDIRPDNRDRRTQDASTAASSCAKPAAPSVPAESPAVLAQPNLDQRADIQRQMGATQGREVPKPAAAGALDYGALLGEDPTAAPSSTDSPLGAGQAGKLSPAEMEQLQTTQRAVVDAGTVMFAAAAGMNIKDIAERFDTSVAELEKLNPGLAQQLRDKVGEFTQGANINVPVGASDVQATLPPADPNCVKQFGERYGSPSPAFDAVRSGPQTMMRGMGGESVKDLQRKLNAMGAKLDVDGKFGPKTEAALKAFQSANGIQQTGVLGKQTLGSLEGSAPKRIPEGAAEAALSGPTSTTPASNLTGSAFGQQLAGAAERSARSRNTVGSCAAGVSDALNSLGVSGRGNAYQKANQLAANPRFQEVNVSANDLRSLPPGAVVVWGRSAAKPYGHVSVALGGGREASDHVQNQITGGRYGTDFGNGPDPQGRQFRVFLPR